LCTTGLLGSRAAPRGGMTDDAHPAVFPIRNLRRGGRGVIHDNGLPIPHRLGCNALQGHCQQGGPVARPRKPPGPSRGSCGAATAITMTPMHQAQCDACLARFLAPAERAFCKRTPLAGSAQTRGAEWGWGRVVRLRHRIDNRVRDIHVRGAREACLRPIISHHGCPRPQAVVSPWRSRAAAS